MRRSTVRLFASIVLALLGVPVAMHVVVHDLRDHQGEHANASVHQSAHGDHEHPMVSPTPPQVPDVTRIAPPVALLPARTTVTWARIIASERNVVSFGASRIDDDVGLQRFLSTFLI